MQLTGYAVTLVVATFITPATGEVSATGVAPRNDTALVTSAGSVSTSGIGASTITGFRITPVLALVKPGYHLVANPDEVDAVFETPLSFLMNPANHRQESRVWENVERHYFVMPFGEHQIWGVTAGIIRTMYERLYA